MITPGPTPEESLKKAELKVAIKQLLNVIFGNSESKPKDK